MAVFTEVTLTVAQELFKQLDVGKLRELQGIKGGIENTNYFATTDKGEYVLTVFERLTHEQLPFYLNLMRHLAGKNIPVPLPQANSRGEILFTLYDKPACVVNKLAGVSQLQPQPHHCATLGSVLARMHLAAKDYAYHQPNLRGLNWWNATAPLVYEYLNQDQKNMLEQELDLQNKLACSADYVTIPRGAIHADLFRDNVLFVGDTLTGCFDFYFAGVDTWLFDICVCLNDWCIEHASGKHDANRTHALLEAYQKVRPLTQRELILLPNMARAAALRFWISRLWDFYLPRDASMLSPHDPTHFERILKAQMQQPLVL